jgi:aryl-alcohol dehydrogenase-like predicted oxidoreductase
VNDAVTTRDFTHRALALGTASGRPVHRLGLALNYGIDPRGFDVGVERGMNYFFYTQLRTKALLPSLRRTLRARRESCVVAAGPSIAYVAGNVRSGVEKRLRELETDYLDVVQLFWLGVGSAWTDGTIDALMRLRDEGKVRAIGVSIHDRKRAGALAESSPLDLFMVRYNAAHPGAERDIFPHLATRQPKIVAYTATSRKALLRRPRGWSGPVMTAGDCYRFCLSSPHVDVALCGPASTAELTENLDALERGPLTPDEAEWMRAFGAAAHG